MTQLDNLDLNPLSAQNLENPYPFYARLRAAGPVYFNPQMGCWVVTRQSEINSVLQYPRFSAQRMNIENLPPSLRSEIGPLYEAVGSQMLFLDPPAHTRLRALVNKAFTPRVVEGLRGYIQQVADDLLDIASGSGRMDLIADFAYPLPVTVIAQLLGVHQQDRAQFKKWSQDFAVLIGGSATLEQALACRQSLQDFGAYLRQILAEMQADPQENLLAALAQAEIDGNRLSEQELFANCLLLLAAGHETTTNLIGNGVLALLEHPAQLEKLRNDPSLAPGAVEEILRFDSPVQWTERIPTTDLELGGQAIQRGQSVMLALAAANHDPALYPQPQTLDITRSYNKHAAFGHGIHYCVGAALARMEGQIAFNTLLRRFPSLRLTSTQLERPPMMVFRGVSALPVSLN